MWILLAPLAVVGILLFIAIGGAIVMLLWNWLLPPLFGLPSITFWQGLGLLLLCRILFGGLGGHRSHRSGVRSRFAERWDKRRAERWAERWERMTPEERDRIRRGMRDRCGVEPPDGGTSGE